MATISSKDIICTMLKNDGVYPGDPQVFAISRYTGAFGREELFHIAVSRQEELDEAINSPYVRDLQVLWKRGEGLTKLGASLDYETGLWGVQE